MKRSISTFLIAGAMAIGGVACEQMESGMDRAGERTGETLDEGAQSAERGAESLGEDTRQAFQGVEEDVQQR